MAFGIHSTLRELLADERARAVLEQHIPGASTHPRRHEGMDMTLAEIAAYPEAGLSPEKLQALAGDLARL